MAGLSPSGQAARAAGRTPASSRAATPGAASSRAAKPRAVPAGPARSPGGKSAAVPAGPVPAGPGQAGPDPAGPGSLPRPLSITIALVIEALEALVVLAAAVFAGVATAQGRSYQLTGGIAITVIGVVTAGLLGLVANGLRPPRRWTRTPALMTQLFTGIVGIYLLQSGRYGWGAPAVGLALVGAVMLLVPPSTRALTVGMPQPADRHKRRPASS